MPATAADPTEVSIFTVTHDPILGVLRVSTDAPATATLTVK